MDNIFPIQQNDFGLYICVIFSNILTSIAGIGGGIILLSFFLLFNYNIEYAIPLCISSILGNSFTRYLLLQNKKHYNQVDTLIDYSLILQIITFNSSGSFIGYILNKIISDIIIKYIIIVILSIVILKTITKTYHIYKKEKRSDTRHVYIDGISVTINNSIINYEIRDNYKVNSIWYKFIILLFYGLYCIFIPYKNVSPIYIGLLQSTYCIIYGIIVSFFNIEYQPSPNIKWNIINMQNISICSFLIGIVSTLCGIGGGILITPLLLNINIDYNIVLATTSLSSSCSSLTSTLQYIDNENYLYKKAILFCCLSSISSLLGLKVYKYYNNILKSKVYIMSLLLFLMIISLILLIV